MCLITIALQQHDEYPVIIIANRDEFFQRPAVTAHYWDDHPDILAGRDLEKGATWFGLNRNGRFAAVTNIHTPGESLEGKRSRGELVKDFLLCDDPVADYLQRVNSEVEQYAGFNLLTGDSTVLSLTSKAQPLVVKLEPGIHALSNAAPGIHWPKTRRSIELMKQQIRTGIPEDADPFFGLLADTTLADECELQSAGLPPGYNRELSSIFVAAGDYGTRCSTVLLLGRDGGYRFYERSFNRAGNTIGTVSYTDRD